MNMGIDLISNKYLYPHMNNEYYARRAFEIIAYVHG